MSAPHESTSTELLDSPPSLETHYDFIVCGSGSSGSVVARRLAEHPDVRVLLLEAGGTDDVPGVMDSTLWPTNLGTERDWNFHGVPDPRINGRSMPLSMGKVLGGGSSINGMVWARGHRADWDFYASEAGDPAWSYASVLSLYRKIEDWHGRPDPEYRGTGGPVFVQPAPNPQPLASAMVDAARSIGLPSFDHPNGQLMESAGGAAIMDMRVRDGKRLSVFRSYVGPYLERSNLTVLTNALVTRVIFDGRRATGVELAWSGRLQQVRAEREVVLSLGAFHTPKVLMHSGIGDEAELKPLGIPLIQHLPGVGRNFQDHLAFDCIWEYQTPLPPQNNLSEAVFFANTKALGSGRPDIFVCQAEVAITTDENARRFGLPDACWSFHGGIAQPHSTGRVRLTSADPMDPLRIEANTFANEEDLKTAIACVELCREIGNSDALRPFSRREIMPGPLKGAELENYVRDAATTFWHETCTAKMGRDELSVVDNRLRVYGVECLRIADGSILPRLPTGNTMASCVIVGERAAEMLKQEHGM